jgi:hypothetical protein
MFNSEMVHYTAVVYISDLLQVPVSPSVSIHHRTIGNLHIAKVMKCKVCNYLLSLSFIASPMAASGLFRSPSEIASNRATINMNSLLQAAHIEPQSMEGKSCL